jgi:hypothetical protein
MELWKKIANKLASIGWKCHRKGVVHKHTMNDSSIVLPTAENNNNFRLVKSSFSAKLSNITMMDFGQKYVRTETV